MSHYQIVTSQTSQIKPLPARKPAMGRDIFYYAEHRVVAGVRIRNIYTTLTPSLTSPHPSSPPWSGNYNRNYLNFYTSEALFLVQGRMRYDTSNIIFSIFSQQVVLISVKTPCTDQSIAYLSGNHVP